MLLFFHKVERNRKSVLTNVGRCDKIVTIEVRYARVARFRLGEPMMPRERADRRNPFPFRGGGLVVAERPTRLSHGYVERCHEYLIDIDIYAVLPLSETVFFYFVKEKLP